MVPADETYSTRVGCVWFRQTQGAEKLYGTGRRSVLHLSGVARAYYIVAMILLCRH